MGVETDQFMPTKSLVVFLLLFVFAPSFIMWNGYMITSLAITWDFEYDIFIGAVCLKLPLEQEL